MSDPTEVIATVIHNKSPKCYEQFGEDICQCVHKADLAVAALRADGWDLYRPEECEIDPIMEFIPEGDPIPEGAFEVMEGLWAKRVGERVILETRLVPVSEGTEQ